MDFDKPYGQCRDTSTEQRIRTSRSNLAFVDSGSRDVQELRALPKTAQLFEIRVRGRFGGNWRSEEKEKDQKQGQVYRRDSNSRSEAECGKSKREA
jgi:hypothetical protein